MEQLPITAANPVAGNWQVATLLQVWLMDSLTGQVLAEGF